MGLILNFELHHALAFQQCKEGLAVIIANRDQLVGDPDAVAFDGNYFIDSDQVAAMHTYETRSGKDTLNFFKTPQRHDPFFGGDNAQVIAHGFNIEYVGKEHLLMAGLGLDKEKIISAILR